MPDSRDSFTAHEVCEGMLSQINVRTSSESHQDGPNNGTIALSSGSFKSSEIKSGRLFWEKAIQQHHYADVLERFHAKQQHPLIRQLDLFLSANGLLRRGGRL